MYPLIYSIRGTHFVASSGVNQSMRAMHVIYSTYCMNCARQFGCASDRNDKGGEKRKRDKEKKKYGGNEH